MKIPENSTAAMDNGLYRGIALHELSVHLGPKAGEAFLAHDQVAGRVTDKDGRWSSLSVGEILEANLVTRRYDFVKNDFASSYEETGITVPELENVLREYEDIVLNSSSNRGCTFQLDLMGEDFARAVAWFRYRRASRLNLLLKGYNDQYSSGQELENAIAKYPVGLVFIFYSYPIVNLAFKAKGSSKPQETSSITEKLSLLSYDHLHFVTEQHVRSFLDARVPPNRYCHQIIPEIVYTGLGLGYSIRTGQARDPRNHKPITDPEILFDSRVDRLMLGVALKLRKDTHMPHPQGEKGMINELRSVHWRFYPQSDIVVADDPIAEIAARTWTDEYAKLDRAELLYKSWNEWLQQGGDELVEAVREINGPFLPNRCEIVVD
ncbi:hypothetical protein QBC43DRAFT_290104 [Cladorrhinum sp. PSN259]|nr:hypothetical protein QBC43DRAFT_290104 [Cladorrhinum sp. PSN259]